MEGYLELKSQKFLHANRKYWFVLGPVSLSYYNHEADVSNSDPVDIILLKDIFHVDVYYSHKHSIKIITNRKSYVLKAKGGNDIHNWMGNIKEKWHASKEGLLIEHGPKTKKKPKKKVTRSQSRNESDMQRNIQSLHMTTNIDQLSKRFSRSMNNLKTDVDAGRERKDSTSSIASTRYRRLDSASSVSSNRLVIGDSPKRNRLGTGESSSRMVRGTSCSSLRSGSSVGSNGRSKRTPIIPINTPLAHKFALQNESRMNDKVDIIISEDLEEFARISDVEDEYRDDVVDSPIDEKKFNDNPPSPTSPVKLRQTFDRSVSSDTTDNDILRKSIHVKFKSQEDIRRISIRNIKRKSTGRYKKRRNKHHDEEEDSSEIGDDQKSKHSTTTFSWLTNSLLRKRSKKKETIIEETTNKEEICVPSQVQTIQEENIDEEKDVNLKKCEQHINVAAELKQVDRIAMAIVNTQTNLPIKQRQELPLSDKEMEAKAKLINLIQRSQSVQQHRLPTDVEQESNKDQTPIIVMEQRPSTLPRIPSRKSSDSSMSFSSVVMDTLSVNKSKRNSSRHSSPSSDTGSFHNDALVGEEIKEKVHKWRQKSRHKTETILEISGPIGKNDSNVDKKEEGDMEQEKKRLLAEIDAQCVPKITDENKEDFLKCPLPQETVTVVPIEIVEPDKTPEIPQKSSKFQIRQLELLMNGKLNPKEIDQFQVMLQLESLKIVADLDEASHLDDQDDKSEKRDSGKPLYDTPRPLEAPISLINTKYKNRISLQSDPDTSIYYNQQELSFYRNHSVNASRESSVCSDSNMSNESVVVLRKKS